MLSLFPNILFLAPFSIFFIRLALAITLVYSAWNHLSKNASATTYLLGVLEALAAVAVGAGVWTQAGGVVASMILATEIVLPRTRAVALGTALLALVMAASLIVTGAGVFSFDLPL